MAYFECNLPSTMPGYINPSKKAGWERMSNAIITRFAKLEEAYQKVSSKMAGEQFALAVKPLFDAMTKKGVPVLDTLTSQQLADHSLIYGPALEYVPRLEWPNAETVVDAAFLTREEWEIMRGIGIGGSDSALGEGFSTLYEIYHKKVGTELFDEFVKEDGGKQLIFDYGHAIEDVVIGEFCRRTGGKVIPETRMFRSKKYPWMTANIDAIVALPDGTYAVFEAKTTRFWNRDAWQDEKIPRYYKCQVRHYCVVLDDPKIVRGYIGCLYGNTPNDFRCKAIERDDFEEKRLISNEKAFWEDNILAGVEPPSYGDERDETLLRRIVGPAQKNIVPVDIPVAYKSLANDYMDYTAQISAHEQAIEDLKQAANECSIKIKEFLKNETYGELKDSTGTVMKIVWRPISGKRSVNYDLLELLYPQAFKDCVLPGMPEVSRSFSITATAPKK